MNKVIKNKIVPKLRFPEFKNNAEWEEKKLGGISSNISSGKNKIDVDGEYDLYGSTGIIGKTNNYSYDGDFLLVARVGANAGLLTRTKGKFGVTDNTLVISLLNSEITDFIHYSLKKFGLNKLIFGSGQPLITAGQIKDIMIYFPEITEQQKIASCLSSLDELISAQSQKLEALKAHKKGLMQQLFPAEGERVPKLRFKEFRNSGVWEETQLGKLGELIPGLTYSPDDVRDKGLLVLRSSNIKDGNIILDDSVYVYPLIKGINLSKAKDILICVRNGSKSLIGKNAIIKESILPCTHGAFMVVFRPAISKFVYQLFQTDSYNKQVSNDLGATINSINSKNLIKYKFYVPKPEEQHKIASCLSSLDELITAQTEKIEALKMHKKGLMQQLFPSEL